ncbi:MAG: DEAD/DEAH box helicase [Deltaproteobacteria bacterium]|nr:DEAD/DEAH box helicase [Deltaproteobacteria bacterium]
MEQHTFHGLKLAEPICKALQGEGYEHPTPIQLAAIPHLLAGRDLIGCARTGTGKTAAFALPMLQQLSTTQKKIPPRGARALILTPTRELAVQVGESFRTYGRYLRIDHALVFGGVGQGPQVKALRRGVDVLVATPGRLLDLINQGHASLAQIEIFVLDEADRMLDMGFLPDIKKVIAMLPAKRQTLLFSATMAPAILKLAEGLLVDPVKVAVDPPASTLTQIDERVLFVDEGNKRALLSELLKSEEITRALVFTRTKHGANRLVKQLEKSDIAARAIHGNKSQTARMAALQDFRTGRCRLLVATDVAARGIDVDGITHVINYDLPNEPESYVHRIGRTARAGASGIALSFCGGSERPFLRDIERLLKRSVPVCKDHPFHASGIANTRGGTSGGAKITAQRNGWGAHRRQRTCPRYGCGRRGRLGAAK